HRCDLTAPVTRCVDDVLGVDRAGRRLDAPAARGELADTGDTGVTVDGGAPIPRPLGERLRQLRRVEIAIARIPQSESDVIELEKGMPLPDLRRGEQLEFCFLCTRLRENVPELIHPVGAVRESDAAGHVIVDVVMSLLRESRVERRGIVLQLED